MLARLSAYWFHTKWPVWLLFAALDIWNFRQRVTCTACNQSLCLWWADEFVLLVSPNPQKPAGLKLAHPHIQNLNPFIEFLSYCHSVDLIQNWKLTQSASSLVSVLWISAVTLNRALPPAMQEALFFLTSLSSPACCCLLPMIFLFVFLPPSSLCPLAFLPAQQFLSTMHCCSSTKSKP